ncbi:MAG: PD40 domain-containing protein [Myxococcales bacterium]|nr:PD40 domain-containing protein [Myxococcales bacterium]
MPSQPSRILLALAACALTGPVHADPPKPDESALGTVDVDGGATAPPQKLAVVPLLTKGNSDTLAQLVVRHDLELSGQFDVIADANAPKGPFLREAPIDPKAWRDKGVDLLVRVVADEQATTVKLRVDVWILASSKKEPAFSRSFEIPTAQARLGAHRVADAVLEAVTGRAGGFASRLAFTGRVGKGQQVFLVDADGFDLEGHGPATDTAVSPAFGPDDEVYYASSADFGPFRLVRGPLATKVTLPVPGSVLGVAFDATRTHVALAVMHDGVSQIWSGDAGVKKLESKVKAPLVNHPVFGPLGKMAWVAGSPPRVFVDGKAVSPPGFAASAPTFCDSPRGLLVVFTVGVGKDADLVATDSAGSGITRLTQAQGANSYPACSPDGRLVAFFSTRNSGKGPGLYVMPIAAPGRAQRLGSMEGESLRWSGVIP